MSEQPAINGIVKITRRERALALSPHAPPGARLRYNVGIPIQLAPKQAALFAGREVVAGQSLDFAGGVEVIPFDNPDRIDPAGALVVSANHTAKHPVTGANLLMMKFWMKGGFIPLGARLPDGRPHPHAGTGFGLIETQGFPLDLAAAPATFDNHWARAPDVYRCLELHQLAYDGRKLRVTRADTIPRGGPGLLPDWQILDGGLCAAVPDGPDLLMPAYAAPPGQDVRRRPVLCGCGLARWRHGECGWRPADFVPVTDGFNGWEPSMVRDRDGALLLAARQLGPDLPEKFDIHVWRSDDNGRTWRRVIFERRLRSESPVTIGITADGTAFIAANMIMAGFGGRSFGYQRDLLVLWPLNAARDQCEYPVYVRCATYDWGPPPQRGWSVDHPASGIVQLGDGRWHTMLTFRGMCSAETCGTLPPTPHTGCYVEEVHCRGADVENLHWRF